MTPDITMLTREDLRNLGLQRTSSLLKFNLFKSITPSYVLWEKLGSNVLLDLEIKMRSKVIVEHCCKEISDEFDALKPHLDLPEGSLIMDIGCGLGLINILIHESFPVSHIALVDIEINDITHHGFQQNGAAYNSLDTAKKFLEDNIKGNVEILTINPEEDDLLRYPKHSYDLIFSLISCGFHYPVETYLNEFNHLLKNEGMILIDLRKGENHENLLEQYKIVSTIASTAQYDRVTLRKKH